jgi:hypothetical protein
MKRILTLIITLLSCGPAVLAEPHNQVPDLAKALAGGKLVQKADSEMIVGYQYEYGSDTTFEALKTELAKFLGAAWKEKLMSQRMESALKKVMKVEGIDLVGQATFSNPAFPEDEISLTMKREKRDGKERRIVTIYGTWRKDTVNAAHGNRR